MAKNPIKSPLPADLPTDWAIGQTVGPNGADVGLSRQHGYNYLCEQLNATQNALNDVGTAFGKLAALDESGKVPETELPSLSFLPLAGGTMQGEIAMGGSAITDLPEPVENSSPVRKQDTFLKPQLLSAETAAKLGLKTIVLKNLVVNGSFENGDEGWDFDNLVSVGPVPSQVSGDWHGSKALSGYQFGAVQTLPATIKPNNMYYFRMLAGTDGISMATVTVTVGSGSVIPPRNKL